jgi:hypothetical protein
MDVTRRAVFPACAARLTAAAKPGRPGDLAAQDGVPVTGRIYGRGGAAVVLVPGGHGVGDTWHLQAERLAAPASTSSPSTIAGGAAQRASRRTTKRRIST